MKIPNLILNLAKPFLSEHDRVVLSWKQIEGDKTLRLNYNLEEDSVVFDLGGYEGEWTKAIFSKYHCHIYVFEPVKEFAVNIRKRFINNKKIRVYDFGLADKTTHITLYMDKSRTTQVKKDAYVRKTGKGRLVAFNEFIGKERVKKIDLMKINIEGGEYDLLENLIKIGWIKNILNLQIQFHPFVRNAAGRMSQIQKQLEKTHQLTYQYRFVWENWRLRNNGKQT